MNRSIKAAILAVLLLACSSSVAAATPAPAFTATPGLNQTFTFDASATVCNIAPCGYGWKYYGATTNRLGNQIASSDPVMSYRFPAIGFYSVVLTVSERCTPKGARYCPASVTQYISVA
jgi:hypothetical protein